MVEIPAAIWDQIWALIVVIITAVIAYIQKIGKDEAVEEKAEVEAFYDSATGNVPVPKSVPDRAWKMNDVTKKFLTTGMSAQDADSALKQVEAAEAAGKTEYVITTSAAWYLISFGLIQGSGGAGKGV